MFEVDKFLLQGYNESKLLTNFITDTDILKQTFMSKQAQYNMFCEFNAVKFSLLLVTLTNVLQETLAQGKLDGILEAAFRYLFCSNQKSL